MLTHTELVLTTPSTTYLASLDDLKVKQGYEDETHDARLRTILAHVTALVEAELDQTFTAQTWTQYFPEWGGAPLYATYPYGYLYYYPNNYQNCGTHHLKLLKGPVTSVVVKYKDENSTEQTLDGTKYRLTNSPSPRVIFTTSDLPALDATEGTLPVWVVMTCGSSIIPPLAQAYCLAMAAEMDLRREMTDSATFNMSPIYERAGRLLRRGLL